MTERETDSHQRTYIVITGSLHMRRRSTRCTARSPVSEGFGGMIWDVKHSRVVPRRTIANGRRPCICRLMSASQQTNEQTE